LGLRTYDAENTILSGTCSQAYGILWELFFTTDKSKENQPPVADIYHLQSSHSIVARHLLTNHVKGPSFDIGEWGCILARPFLFSSFYMTQGGNDLIGDLPSQIFMFGRKWRRRENKAMAERHL
jgi:hypothetical protein